MIVVIAKTSRLLQVGTLAYQNADDLIRKLSVCGKTEATRKLTEFYATARFRVTPEDFRRQYTDGGDDGGIDFYHREDSTYFIFQTKFVGSPRKTGFSEI